MGGKGRGDRRWHVSTMRWRPQITWDREPEVSVQSPVVTKVVSVTTVGDGMCGRRGGAWSLEYGEQ